MARRASSQLHPRWLLFLIGAIALAVGLAVFVQNEGGEPYRTIPTLDPKEYLANANSLRGNIYKVSGVISQSLGSTRGQGRLFSVDVTGSADDVLPILVPPDLGYLNLQKGQHYIFQVEVGGLGILRAREMKKT